MTSQPTKKKRSVVASSGSGCWRNPYGPHTGWIVQRSPTDCPLLEPTDRPPSFDSRNVAGFLYGRDTAPTAATLFGHQTRWLFLSTDSFPSNLRTMTHRSSAFPGRDDPELRRQGNGTPARGTEGGDAKGRISRSTRRIPFRRTFLRRPHLCLPGRDDPELRQGNGTPARGTEGGNASGRISRSSWPNLRATTVPLLSRKRRPRASTTGQWHTETLNGRWRWQWSDPQVFHVLNLPRAVLGRDHRKCWPVRRITRWLLMGRVAGSITGSLSAVYVSTLSSSTGHYGRPRPTKSRKRTLFNFTPSRVI